MARADRVTVCSLPLAKNAMHSPTSNNNNKNNLRACEEKMVRTARSGALPLVPYSCNTNQIAGLCLIRAVVFHSTRIISAYLVLCTVLCTHKSDSYDYTPFASSLPLAKNAMYSPTSGEWERANLVARIFYDHT